MRLYLTAIKLFCVFFFLLGIGIPAHALTVKNDFSIITSGPYEEQTDDQATIHFTDGQATENLVIDVTVSGGGFLQITSGTRGALGISRPSLYLDVFSIHHVGPYDPHTLLIQRIPVTEYILTSVCCSGGRNSRVFEERNITINIGDVLTRFPLADVGRVAVSAESFITSSGSVHRASGIFHLDGTITARRNTTQRDVAVVYVNGINTKQDDASIQAHNLGLHNQDVVEGNVDFFYFYNPTGGFIEDIIESSVQKLRLEGETRETTLDIVRGFAQKTLSPLSAAVVETITQTLVEKAATAPSASESLGLTREIERLLTTYGNVVLIGHSQGNLFVNEAYSELPVDLLEKVSVLGVATPASFVSGLFGRGDYTTERFDKILLVPNALDDRLVENFPRCDPLTRGFGTCFLNHGLIDIYLYDLSETEANIVRQLESAITIQ